MKILQIQSHTNSLLQKTFQAIAQIDIPDDIDFICLPEMFACPYDTKCFPDYAEPFEGACFQFMQQLAIRHHAYVIGGSFPEIDHGHIYNTAPVFDRSGRLLARHRKMHLFDIQVQGGQHFKESDILSAGDAVTTFPTEFGTMGICICYDIRFPELGRLMALHGARCFFVPAAFNQTTGPAHWELTFRAQALFNQVFCVATAPALDPHASYHSWGHSLITDPWGRVVTQAGTDACSQITSIDINDTEQVRQQLPLLKHRRTDLYRLEEQHEKNRNQTM
ncbi:MAG: carbon-nitrogen hydrolase family protein [Catenisphaera adipataccumulans]|jgi:omega-amidase|uniref:carbon-nitrogen hydrolase family protein n=1 Tax=Catenisphaera adipataccumulans TaxID=700500 RepID=UPI003D9389BD